jgi:hypothetical protein
MYHGRRWLLRAGRAMPTHKFKVGETVFLDSSHVRNIPGGAYIITKQLPEHDGDFEYRVRSINEPHERVVRENQLKKAP